jgi:hypothetical protein
MTGETYDFARRFPVSAKAMSSGIDWASERTVAHAVKVVVELVATRKP